MRRIILFALLGMVTATIQAQIPSASKPVCAYCGVSLTSGESHKPGCRYYEAPQEEEESSSSSTHLKDHTPLPEMSSLEHTLIYEVGVNGEKPCSHCQSLYHQSWCEVIKPQNWAKQYWAKAIAATNEAVRKKALWDYRRMVDNLKIFIDPNYSKADLEAHKRKLEREERERKERIRAEQQAKEQAQQLAAHSGYQHLSSVDLKNGYDKKLGLGSGHHHLTSRL